MADCISIHDFDYHLPPELVAKYPLPARSDSRLLCLSRTQGDIQHQKFSDLPTWIHEGDLLVFNNTRVIPARLFANKLTGGRCEILIERLVDEHHAWAHVRASKAPRPGTVLNVDKDILLVTQARKDALYLLEAAQPFSEILEQHGHTPLPSYMEREDETLDIERYQTVYAKTAGAVAAPTAGLHFDESLLSRLQERGVQFAYVTLHVGAGTFQPVRVDNILEHTMHHEYAEVCEVVCEQIRQTKLRGNRVIAVGTTSARSLETAAIHGELQPFNGETNLFIYPGFEFKVIDGLLTNFHFPKSTLLMLVSAFAGRESVMQAYQAAIQEKYRFYSYGDAMLIY